MSHYDRNADIAWLLLEGFDAQHTYGEDHPWGLIERDRESGDLVGVELWRASERLPRQLLDALPEPEGSSIVVERSDLAKGQAA